MFSQLADYLESKQYSLTNLSKMSNPNMLLKHYDETKTQSNIVLYIEKNDTTDILFKGEQLIGKNLLLFNKTSYCFFIIPDFNTYIIDDQFKKNIDVLLNSSNKPKQCDVCFEESEYAYYCQTCSYRICKKCVEGLETYSNGIEIKCPQCRTNIFSIEQ